MLLSASLSMAVRQVFPLRKKTSSPFGPQKTGAGKFTTARKEADKARILSGVFEGRTTGTPISILISNEDQRSHDYGNIKDCYRPGHADYTFDTKYGFAIIGAVGALPEEKRSDASLPGLLLPSSLQSLAFHLQAYTCAIGDIKIPASEYRLEEISENALYMPGNAYAAKAASYLEQRMKACDSSGNH